MLTTGQIPNGEPDRAQLLAENAELRARLEEAEETLRAISSGEVDALVVEGKSGTQIFTLQGIEAESNQFRGDILAQISDAVVAVDNEEHVTYLNGAAERQYGIRSSDALGRQLRELWTVHWPWPADETVATTALRDTGRWRGESVHIKRSGEEIHVESAVSRLHDASGTPVGTLATIRDISDRKRIEEALLRNEVLFSTIIEQAPGGVYVVDDEFRVRHVNSQSRAVFAAAEPVIGRDFTEVMQVLWGPELGSSLAAIFRHTLETGERYVSTDFTAARHDLGVQQSYEWETRRLTLPNGRHGVVCYYTDTTTQRDMEAALRASEQRATGIIQSIADGFLTLDAEWRITYLSPRGAELLALPQKTPGNVLERIFWEAFPATLGTEIEENHRRAMRDQVPVQFESFYPPLGRWFDYRVYPSSGGLTVYFLDITDKRSAVEGLRASEARKKAILTSALDAIVTMDHEGRLLEFNPAAERIFGHERASVLGRRLAEVILPERLRESHHHGLQHYLETGVGPVLNKQIELPALRADGTEFPAEFAIVPIPDAEPPVFTAFLRDVTARKEMEDSLHARAAELAEADRRKNEFLAMLAHELRNPLAPLRNAAEILRMPGGSEEEHTQAHRIVGRSIENMSRMIDDLLDVSRITEGKIELRREPVSLEAILTAAASLVRCSCAVHCQELTVTLPAEPVWLHADATRLEQVFGNLLGNACKYAGDGCRIDLSAERGEGEIMVRVSDNGVGIEPGLLPHIFDLFVQASRTLDRAHGGLGIGLTLVQRLVKLHGGSIRAHSEGLGHGAEFIVHLPILAEAPPPPPAPPPVVGETPRRILVVDDNTDSARSLAALQKRRGHETRTAFTGPEAVAVAADFLPEVVLLDIGLPGMDGFAVARELRAMPALQGVLLIAMTGYGHGQDRARAAAAGFDEYMVKPLDLAQLQKSLAARGKRSA
jgi:PAS domain S-box-containing protein